MIITIRNNKLTIGEIISRKINENFFSESELQVIKLIRKWFSKEEDFEFKTSGSTGQPKKIILKREQLLYSASTTLKRLDPKKQFKKSLLCLDPSFIGGAMVVIRSLTGKIDLTVSAPSGHPFDHLKDSYDLVSMVPLQVQKMLDLKNDQLVGTLLIGGAGLSATDHHRLNATAIKAFHTYGMTETASHIALKDLRKDPAYFESVGDIQLDTDSRNCLMLKGTITNNQWIQTNDVVELRSDSSFEWKGRADFIINTGGIKVNPEEIEKEMEPYIRRPFIIGSEPDDLLGNKVIMIVEGTPEDETEFPFDHLHRYARPKKIYFLPSLSYTDNGKIDRLATQNLIHR